MNSKRYIIALLWFAYTIVLAHSIVPHHHHETEKDCSKPVCEIQNHEHKSNGFVCHLHFVFSKIDFNPLFFSCNYNFLPNLFNFFIDIKLPERINPVINIFIFIQQLRAPPLY